MPCDRKPPPARGWGPARRTPGPRHPSGHSNPEGKSACPSRTGESCWRPVSISATRPGAGTLAWVATSMASATGSTSSTCSRRRSCSSRARAVRRRPRRKGGTILSGTKKQARDAIQEWAERSGMPFVNQRWLGGLLTNFSTISKRIDRAARPHEPRQRGSARSAADEGADGEEAELRKLEYNLGGVRDMKRLPQAVFIVDLKTEAIALDELRSSPWSTQLRPDPVDHVIPGNDDGSALRAGDPQSARRSASRPPRGARMEERRRAEEERKRRRRPSKRRAEERKRPRRPQRPQRARRRPRARSRARAMPPSRRVRPRRRHGGRGARGRGHEAGGGEREALQGGGGWGI